MNAIAVFDPKTSILSGKIFFSQSYPHNLVHVEISLKGFPPDRMFACHIHEYGDLSDGCTSACSHFNPEHQKHGSFELYGQQRHVGDLAIPYGNLRSDKNGHVNISFTDDLIQLFPHRNNIIGRMVVIHENPDDLGFYRNENTPRGIESGKTGNAGKRIACSIIGICK